jgi:error-prone DNA polymerase
MTNLIDIDAPVAFPAPTPPNVQHPANARMARIAHNAYVELHMASAFSFLRGASSPEALVAQAASLGMRALALTDHMTLAGVVRFQAACAAHAIQPIVGVELAVAEPVFGLSPRPSSLSHLVALAENATGYARLCHLLTDANLAHPEAPVIPWRDLAAEPDGLVLLTGGREGSLMRLLLAGKRQAALETARRYYDAFGPERVFVELQHHKLPDTLIYLQQLVEIADEAALRCVATNGVHYTTRDDCSLFDLMTCTRLGLTVDQPHAERPCNAEAHLKSRRELASLFARVPHGRAALRVSGEIAARCHLSLLKGACTAPQVALPTGTTPTIHLRNLCAAGLKTRYATQPDALLPGSPQRTQLDHELSVISQLHLEEFFLCVHDIMHAARAMGIRVSGRGSAANSLAAYCLGITGVDPIHHKLLFERFLNPDRGGMPDIDVDVQSDRRDELIRYVERTYSETHAAMVANVITYRARSAIRDAAKALGYPLELVNRLTKRLSHHADAEELLSHESELRQVIGTGQDAAIRERCLERLPLLLSMAPKLLGLPRHLSLHNGGMVLTREPLSQLLPVRISANGVRALEVDKDDVERLGLIKFDLLGLRTLGAVEEALNLIEQTTGARPDIDHLPTTPPDPRTMALIRSGQTLAVFQIESPGQWHLLAQTQPTTFNDLIVQTALFRPGPIQGGFVHPYIERRLDKQAQHGEHPEHPKQAAAGAQAARYIQQERQQRQQRDAVQTPWKGTPRDDFWTAHPVLAPILAESEGILLFQEQILEIAHRFAGLSYADADGFRRAMSHQRSRREMEAMRARFVGGALARGETHEAANRVFDAVSAFVGYGFCKSHAAEFARTIYQTAWLKAHYPAHYLAAFLSAQPAGYFPPHVVLEEAKRLRIPVLPVHMNASEDRFSVEPAGSVGGYMGSGHAPGGRRWGIRIGLRQVSKIGEDLARAILWERRTLDESGQLHERPFTSLWDLLVRLRPAGLTRDAAEALVWSGACDSLAPRMERRQRLWQLRELWPLVDPHPKGRQGAKGRGRGRTSIKSASGSSAEHLSQPQQLILNWEMPMEALADVPDLPSLTAFERDALDYQLLGMSARPHPMRHYRPLLDRRGVLRIADLAHITDGHVVRVAGWPISAQRPPTAHGVGFVVLEDETGRLPLAMSPALAADLRATLRDAHYLVAIGRLERVRWYRSLWAFQLIGMSEIAVSHTA